MKRAVNYDAILLEHLKDPAVAAEYLTACYEDGPEIFQTALQKVLEAEAEAGRRRRRGRLREDMRTQLARGGTLSLSNVAAVLADLRLKVSFSPA